MTEILHCQRWREGSSCMRPAREVVDVRRFDVAPIDDATARAFVKLHHYAKTCPPAFRATFGLFDGSELVGVAIFANPFTAETITGMFPTFDPDEGTELSRFVLLDRVGANAETWFLSRCFELIDDAVAGVVSFSDPQPRTTLDGRVVFPGHIGTIYQAMNARYRGISEDSSRRLMPDGTEFSNFESGKIRRNLSGKRAAVAKLVALGADPLPDDAPKVERIAWLERWRTELTRPFRHRGNHRYCWLLDQRRRRELPYGPERAYPKRRAA